MISQKGENGSYTIEAAFTLTIFLFFMMTFLAFGRYTAVQNDVKHSLNQAVITMSEVNLERVRNDKYWSSLMGTNKQEMYDFISLLSEDLGNQFWDANKKNIPYTSTTSVTSHYTRTKWENEDLKLEVIRYFAYYYLADVDYSPMDKDYDKICDDLKKCGLEILEISSVTKENGSAYFSEENQKNNKVTYTGPDSTITQQDGNITKSNTFVDGKKITVNIKYKIKTGFSFHKLFGIVETPEFQDSVTFVLME